MLAALFTESTDLSHKGGAQEQGRGGEGLPPRWLEGVSPSLQVASSGRGEAETGTGQALQPWVWVEKEEKVSQAENRTVQRWEPEFPAGCV